MIYKVAVLQKRAEQRKKVKNVQTIIDTMKEAAENQADILLLPECFITGYELPIEYEEVLTEESIEIKELCEAARTYQIGVVATAFSKGKKKPRNTAYVIDKQGHIQLNYSKVHTCDFADEAMLEHGKEFNVSEVDGVKIGIMICYDREYPESARILMLKGAEIILVPNDCGAMKPRIQALSTRAYENMVGVVMANPNGENAGCSCAYSPICWDEEGNCIDNTLLLASEKAEGLFYVEFDMAKLRNYREHEMMGNTYRKVEAYNELLCTEIKAPFIRN